MTTSKTAQWLTFALMNISLIVFALYPLRTLIYAEVVVVIVSAISFVMVTLERFHPLRWTQYGYLFTGASALYTAVAFTFTNDWPADWSIPTTLMLLTFAVGGYATHITGQELDNAK